MFITKSAEQNLIAKGADGETFFLYSDMDKPFIIKHPADRSGIPKHPENVCFVILS